MRLTAPPTTKTLDGGWALTDWPLTRKWVHVPAFGDSEPPYAVADAWTPPHPLAVGSSSSAGSPESLCDRILVAASYATPAPSPTGTYYHDVDLSDDDRQEVFARFQRANGTWWNVDVNRWLLGVKRYRPGDRHALHQDLHAGAAGRKFAGVVQLSDPADYTGGQLVIHFAEDRAVMPAARGTLVAFPGWTVHEVTPVTSGERWSLCVNAWGPPLR